MQSADSVNDVFPDVAFLVGSLVIFSKVYRKRQASELQSCQRVASFRQARLTMNSNVFKTRRYSQSRP